MPRWRGGERKVSFEDMPERLQDVGLDDELKQERADWLESHDLSFVDYLGWLRSRDPAAKLRPPSRRKLLTQQQVAELDAQREREERPLW